MDSGIATNEQQARATATPVRRTLGLTPTQRRVLDAIGGYIADSGISPTLQWLADALNVSKVTILGHVLELQRKGYVRRDAKKSRSIRVVEPDDGWISIKDRLPDDDVNVLIASSVADEPVWFGYFDDGKWRYADGTPAKDVTHWRCLPDPPKGNT